MPDLKENKEAFRIENDSLGEARVPLNALYGIHAARASENFDLTGRPVHPTLIKAFGTVKGACAKTNYALGFLDKEKAAAIEQACTELSSGQLKEHIIVDALQGGAGTSLNMNMNEVIANRALQLIGKQIADYETISPLHDINLHQSTNDTFPTALKLAAIKLLKDLDEELTQLVMSFQKKEQEFSTHIKIGRTQLQDAVPITLGREMSAYADAFGRDRWRIYKSEERLRVVNLGGTAIGTGLTAPRDYIFRVVDTLRDDTGIGFSRADNLVECTQNADVFVEVSGLLKALASNVIKCTSDLRLMASGPDNGLNEIRLPARQAGSSIMPNKVNPIITEAATQAAIRVIGADTEITWAASSGVLELNAFLPLVADSLLGGIELITKALFHLRTKCIDGIEANKQHCLDKLNLSTALTTALLPKIGYTKASLVAKEAAATHKTVKDVVLEKELMTSEEFEELTSPHRMIQLGYTMGKE